MNNLNDKMKERLEKWRQNTLAVSAASKLRPEKNTRRGGKGDYGDVLSIEQWEEETRKSQNRR